MKFLSCLILLIPLTGFICAVDPPKLYRTQMRIQLNMYCSNDLYENDMTNNHAISLRDRFIAAVRHAYTERGATDKQYYHSVVFTQFACYGEKREPVINFEIVLTQNRTFTGVVDSLLTAITHTYDLIVPGDGVIAVVENSLKEGYVFNDYDPQNYVQMKTGIFTYHFCELKQTFKRKLAAKLILPDGNGTYSPSLIFFSAHNCHDKKARLNKAVVRFYLVKTGHYMEDPTATRYAFRVLDQMLYDGSLWKVGLGLHKEVEDIEYIGVGKDDGLTDLEIIYIGVGSVAGLLLLIIIIVMICTCCCACCSKDDFSDDEDDSTGSTRKKPEYLELDIVTTEEEVNQGYTNKIYEEEKKTEVYPVTFKSEVPPTYQNMDETDAVTVQIEQPIQHAPPPPSYGNDEPIEIVAEIDVESMPDPVAYIDDFPEPVAEDDEFDSGSSVHDSDNEDGDALPYEDLMYIRDDPNRLNNEYNSIQKRMPTALIYPNAVVQKNRKPDVFPWPDSRVTLTVQGNDPITDYINASVIKNVKGYIAYISTQGPLKSTINDFWRMVYEQSSTFIVMVTPLASKGQELCAQYWPPDSISRQFGNITVQLKKKELKTDFVANSLTITANYEKRNIHLYRYMTFNGGVPESAKSVVAFLLEVRETLDANQGNLPIFLGSTGIGMTAVFIAINEGMIMLEETGEVNVKKIVRLLRKDLAGAVEDAYQYSFIYEALCQYASYLSQ